MVNNVSKPTAKLIKETFLMVHHMQEKATYLINTYCSVHGEPFNDEGFSIPDFQVDSIPRASIPRLQWLALSDADRLKQNFIAYHILFNFLEHTVGEQQRILKTRTLLLARLKKRLGEIQALLSHLGTIMEQMDITKPAVPDIVPVSYGNKSVFQKRLRGFMVCRDYKDWIERTVRDFQLLHEKYPNKF